MHNVLKHFKNLALAHMLAACVANAQATNYNDQPLRPLDTSSPRATIEGFLEHAESGHEAQQTGDANTLQVAFDLTREALDFSQTAGGQRWAEQIHRVVLLKEVLDRLPPEYIEQAPGAADTQRLQKGSWQIPNTRIKLLRQDSGIRAGEWLFSADTVAKLHHYFRRSKHLPILSGSTEGLYATMIENQVSARVATRVRSQLRPVEALSPRAVVDQFLFHVNNAYDLVREVDEAIEADPPLMSEEQAIEAAESATLSMSRAMELIDLSNVAARVRVDVGLEVALMLKEVLDRSPLPPIASIPGEQAALLAGGTEGLRWLFPHTGIEITRLNKGQEPEQYRFSAYTVGNIIDFYTKVEELPYRGETSRYKGEENVNQEDYLAAQVSPGFYDRYITTPGTLVPSLSALWPLVDSLPELSHETYMGQTYWQWAALALSIVFLLVAYWLLRKLSMHVESRLGEDLLRWLKVVPPLILALLVTLAADFLEYEVNLTAWVNIYMLAAATAVTYFLVSLAIYRLAPALLATLFADLRAVDERFENIVQATGTGLGFVIAVVVFVYGIRDLGFDVLPLMAGLGVGGLAVALAIRPTLENIIGGVILYADRPVHVGDYCTFGDQSGVVERIGVRSTRIRARNRTLITIPNGAFVDMQITNWAACETMQIKTIIGVRYETTSEQLRWLLARMRKICLAHPKIETNTLRIRFAGFGASSLDIAVRVYVRTTDWNEYFAVQEDLWLRFMDAIAEGGSSIAFPSTTVYMGEDSGLDSEASARAETEVAAWRESEQLPFPLTPEKLANEVVDTLDYPPKGAGGRDHKHPKGAQPSPPARDPSVPPGHFE
ncbi:MAG: mechanosensitive ion channel family protein [Halieaceae bacterium]